MHRMILLVALLAAFRTGLNAGDGALDRATLRGLKAFNIVIDPLDPQLEKAGLTADMLKSRIDTRLRHAGIALDTNAIEFVGLRIDSAQLSRRGPYGLCFLLAFYQPVALARDQKIRTATQTWDAHTMLVVTPKALVDASLETVDQIADQFVNAYRSVNPQ
jgi:hypothetical protein